MFNFFWQSMHVTNAYVIWVLLFYDFIREKLALRRDTSFDGHLFRRIFLFMSRNAMRTLQWRHSMFFLFVNNIVLHCQEKINV